MDEMTAQIVFGVAVPPVIAALAVVPGARAPRGAGGRDRHAWRIPLALAGPVILAFLALYGRPTEQWQHVLWVPAAGVAAGTAMALTGRAAWKRAVLAVALGGLVTLAIWPVIAREPLTWKLAPGLGTVLLLVALEPLAVRRPGASLPVALAVATGAAAAIVLLSGFIKLTVPFVALALALAACAAISLWRPDLSFADGALAVVVPMLVVAPMVAWLYMTSAGGELPAASFVLPVAAPLLLWLGEIRGLPGRRPRTAFALRGLLVVVACTLAVGLAVRSDEAAADDPMEEIYREMMIGGGD